MFHTFQGHFVWIVIIFPYLEFVELSVVEEVGETSIKGGIGEFSDKLFLTERFLCGGLFHTCCSFKVNHFSVQSISPGHTLLGENLPEELYFMTKVGYITANSWQYGSITSE